MSATTYVIDDPERMTFKVNRRTLVDENVLEEERRRKAEEEARREKEREARGDRDGKGPREGRPMMTPEQRKEMREKIARNRVD